MFISALLFVGISSMVVFAMDDLSSHTPWAVAVTSSMSALIVILLIVIARQPQSSTELAFKVR